MIYFLELTHVYKIHQENIEKFGGSFGVREESLLISAIEMPKQGFGDEFFHAFPFEMAATYLFHISKNHPFVDGNKRASLACMLTFLRMNNIRFTGSKNELEDLVLDTATGKLDKKQIAEFLEKNCQTA